MSEFRTVEIRHQEGWRTVKTIGKFHQWGSELLELQSSSHTFTVGIVELLNGEIITVDPIQITFIGHETT